MEINVDENTRSVNIWLTKAEKSDHETLNLLKPLYDKYHSNKYKVSVFLSGEGNLFDNARDLLLHNRYRTEANKSENIR